MRFLGLRPFKYVRLDEMGVKLLQDPYRCKYVPAEDDLVAARQLGEAIGQKIIDEIAE
jgi:hypothetical protein